MFYTDKSFGTSIKATGAHLSMYTVLVLDWKAWLWLCSRGAGQALGPALGSNRLLSSAPQLLYHLQPAVGHPEG